jgi:hypothetical protein
MSRILRIALLWLLAVALPAQGIAAATMSHCGPDHRGAVPTGVHAGHSHDHGATLAMRSHQHQHDQGTPVHAHGGDDVTGATTGDHQAAKAFTLQKVSKASCSACASCCAGAALPSAIATFEASPAHDGVVAWLPRAVPAFFTDGPDRPPRTVLA